MLDGMYSAAAGMAAQQELIDALSSDMANSSTPGYQGTRVGFHDLLYSSSGPAASGSNVATGSGAAAEVIGRSQVEAQIEPTGQPMDVAINGQAFIEVRKPNGTIGMSRGGSLELDSQGRLTTSSGMLLEPPITLPSGSTTDQLKIAPDGSVSVGARRLGAITLVTVPNPDQLLIDATGTFTATAASGAMRRATGVTLEQAALRGSNVDFTTVMTQMMGAQESYSMESRSIQLQDQMLQIANQVKR